MGNRSCFYLLAFVLFCFAAAGFGETCLEEVLADVNGDCVIDIADLQLMAEQWLDTACTPPNCADIDQYTGVTMSDFSVLSAEWLKSANPDVVINEFMASNTTILADEIGEYPDWIELKNISDATVNLNGWYLTDSAGNTNKWEIPAVSIDPGQFLIIFASNKNLTDPAGTLHTNFTLDINGEYLGLYRPDETVEHDYAPFYTQAEDVSFGLAIPSGEDFYTTGYFLTPTNGADNGIAVSNLGPHINDVSHLPLEPASSDPMVVTATITQKIDPVNPASVKLYYRAMYGGESNITMYDDGAHNDGAAGDNIYGATIPSGIASPGEMIRYYITAEDTNASPRGNREPLFLDQTDMRQSPEYHGTVVTDPTIVGNIGVLHWFVQTPSAADNLDRSGTRASVYFNGEFYDNIFVRIRGGSIVWGIPKLSYKFEFNRGHYFRFSPSEGRVDEFNMNSTYPDKSYMRPILGFESFRDSGGEYCETLPLRVHRNGSFYMVSLFIEQVDGDYLERNGLDPEGALYKMYNTMNSTATAEKKTREYEDNSDLQALVNGVALSGSAEEQYLFDNVNLPSVINYAAVHTIINDYDHAKKNYYAYRDTNGTGEWMYLPWDKDLTFGKQWSDSEYLLDDELFYYSRWGSPGGDNLQNASSNLLLNAIYSNSRTNEMYHRRLRTVADQLLQASGTPYAQRYYENRADELYTYMLPDVNVDYDEWADPWPYGEDQSFATAIAYLKADYLDRRRTHMYNDHSVSSGGNFVDAQVGNPTINIGTIVFNPPSTNQDEEYIELTNPNAVAVDISGWKLTGGVTFTFESGTVILPGETMYVSPNLVAFRARSTSPTGNESNFVRGNYSGHLSSWGETVNLLAADDTLIDTETYAGAPSDQQRYLRVTEMMYHPADPAQPSPYFDEDFEYIELQNIGPSTLEITGVTLTDGVVFSFPAGGGGVPVNENLIAIDDPWRYEQTDTDLGTSWRPYGYNDSSWLQDDALFYKENSGLPAPKNTELTLGPETFYFRTHFNLNADPAVDTITLTMNTVLDDGAIFYINGVEVYRLGMHPTDPYSHGDLADRSVGNAVSEGPFTIPAGSLQAGDNVIAVQVHQATNNSSDVVFGLTLDAEIEYFIPAGGPVYLAPSEYGLLVKNTTAFESRYGTGLNVLGQYTGSLSNGGEKVKLEDATNSTIVDIDYKDSWFGITDGDGFSLNVLNVNDTNLDVWDGKEGWRPSTMSGGTPGTADTGAIMPGAIVINEVLAHSDVVSPYDWVELHNTTGAAINIGGWFLSDSSVDRMKYEIASGVSIPANDYVVFYENLHFGNAGDPGSNVQFQFSENGETVYLQSGLGGVLTGYSVEEDFGASEADIAFGRHYKASTDNYNFVAMSSNTAGGANATPKVGPIVINEIMYHPAGNSEAEYIELLNTSGSSVTLYDSSTSEPWKITEGFDYIFPSGPTTTIAAGDYFLLIKNLAAFTAEYGSAPTAGKYAVWTSAGLSNAGEKVEISMPGDLEDAIRQYIRIDRVSYSDGSHPENFDLGIDPWPTAADGSGLSLSKTTASAYGNDVVNWEAATRSPGSANP